MTRTFATPAAFLASLEDRLRVRARTTGTDLQRLRQLVVYDRLLARLFQPETADIVLKGGLALELRCEVARATRDVDLRMMGRPDAALERLRAAGRLVLGDFFTFEIGPDSRHPTIEAEGLAYEGLRYRATAHLAGRPYGRPFGVDVAFAEPIAGEPELLAGPDWLDFIGVAPTCVRTYPLLTHLAEKVHAYTLSRPTPNSRVKDLPDIALLAGVRPVRAFDLRQALHSTFAHRATHEVPIHLPDPPDFWAAPYREMAMAFGLPWLDLATLLAAVREFLDPALAGGVGEWSPGAWSWATAEPSEGDPAQQVGFKT